MEAIMAAKPSVNEGHLRKARNPLQYNGAWREGRCNTGSQK